MNLSSRILALTFAAAASSIAMPALADQADKDACANLEEGDDCTRGDGDPGTCIPDESDPDVLTCDDDPAGSSGGGGSGGGSAGNGGCSTSGGVPAPLPFALLALAALAAGRRMSRSSRTD